MQIVIDINEGIFEELTKYDKPVPSGNCLYDSILESVFNGTPLPKGHGDLVDRNKINSRFYAIWNDLVSYSNKPSHKELLDKWNMCMDTAPTIIEADTEVTADADSD